MTKTDSLAIITIRVLIAVVVLFGVGVCFPFSPDSVLISGQTQNRNESATGAHTSSDDVVASRANNQRTGFFTAKGVHDLNGIVWKTPKLFSLEKKQPLDDSSPIDFDEYFFGEYGASPPIYAQAITYFSLYAGHGYLVALDAGTGRQIWSLKRERGHISDPSISGNLVYVGIGSRTIVGVNAKTGQEQWRFSAPSTAKPVKGLRLKLFSGVYAPSPVVANQLVVFGTLEGDIYAVDQATKALKWNFQADGSIGRIAVAKGVAYFGTSSGSAYSVDLTSGQERWKINAQVRWPVVADGSLYFSDKGSIYAVDAATGQTKWKAKARGKIGTGFALAYDTIYFGGLDDSIYALDANNGQEKWRFKTLDSCDAPVIADGIVYAGGSEHLFAIDAHSGAQIWVLTEKKVTMSSPAVTDGVLYMLADEGYVYAIR